MDIPIELFSLFIGTSIALAIFGFLRNPQIPAMLVFGGMFILTISVSTDSIQLNSFELSEITDYNFTTVYEVPFGTTQYRLNGTYTVIAERFITSPSPQLGQKFDVVNINLARVGTLTGNYEIGVFNGQGNTISTFCTYNATALLTSFVDTSCHFNGYVLSQNDRIGIKYISGNTLNYIAVRADTNNVAVYSNMERFNNGWSNVDPSINHDMRMKLLYNKPVNVFSNEYQFTELPKTLFALLAVIFMLTGALMVIGRER